MFKCTVLDVVVKKKKKFQIVSEFAPAYSHPMPTATA